MEVKIKKLDENAVIPQYAHASDAGLDLVATKIYTDENHNLVIGTGLALEIPTGYVGLLFPRSSNSKQNVLLTNSVGIIDSGYRGEVMLKFAYYRWNNYKNEYRVGDRVGQMIIMPYPSIVFKEVQELSESDRGDCGYGSTGK